MKVKNTSNETICDREMSVFWRRYDFRLSMQRMDDEDPEI